MPSQDWILLSAGEASGDRYAAGLQRALASRLPGSRFFGCAGAAMREAHVEPVVRTESLSVVGIVEVLRHIPRIWGEYQRLLAAARERRPRFAVLVDAPDFHLRVARRLHSLGIPVFYFVAPQAWAWREGRAAVIRRNVRQLHCIFPFEEPFFRQRGVEAHYVGHPLSRLVQPAPQDPSELRRSLGLDPQLPVVALCPGSRAGEIARHWPVLSEAVMILAQKQPLQAVLALPAHAAAVPLPPGVRRIDGRTSDVLAAATLGLVASGTVATEAMLIGTPMVTFYRVAPLTYTLGRPLVNVPFYTMVNLVAGRAVVPELIQNDLTPQRLADEALPLLKDSPARAAQRAALAETAARLRTPHHPLERSADLIVECLERNP